jgi:hypothetical protein
VGLQKAPCAGLNGFPMHGRIWGTSRTDPGHKFRIRPNTLSTGHRRGSVAGCSDHVESIVLTVKENTISFTVTGITTGRQQWAA